ncbi:MAG: Ig-like domain-containing protein [bacterium]
MRHFFVLIVLSFLISNSLFAQDGGFSLDFDGEGGFVKISDSSSLRGSPNRSKTVEAWVKLVNLKKDRPIIQKWKDTQFKEWGLMVDGSFENEVSVAIENNGSNFEYKAGGGVIVVNRWHHIAMTYDGSSHIVRIFIDGVEYGNGEVVPGGMPSTNARVLLGRHAYQPEKRFRGKMDEVRVWNVKKSAEELQALMNKTLAGNESGLVAYWTFDEGGGSTVVDHSTKNHDGDIVETTTDFPRFANSGAPVYDGAFVYVASPGGSERLDQGSTHTIRWNSSGAGSTVDIEFSQNAGASWEPIEAATPNDGEFDWTVPVIETMTALIRITSTSNGSLSDVSDLNFTIQIPDDGSEPPAGSGEKCAPVDVGFRDYYYGGTDVMDKPTEDKPESKLWFHDGSWWGVLWDPLATKYRIYRFNRPTQCWTNTETDVDERAHSAQDVLWDGEKLYVASRATSGHKASMGPSDARLYRYSYDAGTQTYRLDSGFPVTLNMNDKVESLVIDKDSTGQLWATWTDGGKVWINRTLGDDRTWGDPFKLPVQGGATDPDDISSLIAFDQNKIGVIWSNQNDSKAYFAVHKDSNSDQNWERREVALSDGSKNISDDHFNLATHCATGEILVATKTNLSNLDDDGIYLLKRTPDGRWTRHVIGLVRNHLTRPMVLVDSESDSVYVFSSRFFAPRTIELKVAHIDDLNFPAGTGRTFIFSSKDSDVNNVKSTKQCVNSTTGILAIASASETKYYLHNFINPAGGSSNLTPIARDDQADTREGVTVAIDVAANDFDIDGSVDNATVTILNPPGNGTATLAGAGLVTYTPNPGFVGLDSFTYTIQDDQGAVSNQALVSVNVNDNAGGQTFNFVPTDDGQVKLTAPGKNYGAKATAKVEHNKFRAYFKFNVSGLTGPVQSARLRLRVSNGISDGSSDGGAVYQVSNNFIASSTPWRENELNAGNAPAIDGSRLSSASNVSPNDLVELDLTSAILGNGEVSFALVSSSTNKAKYDTREGTIPPQLIIETGAGGGANNPPTASDDQATTMEDVSVTIAVLSNDNDSDGALDPATVSITRQPSNGAASVNGDGTVEYLPDAGFVGVDSFEYTVQDNNGATSNAATVTVTVNASGGGGTQTLTFQPTDDGQVKLTERRKNYGAKSSAKIEADKFNSYFKFVVSGLSGPVQNARLRLRVAGGISDGGDQAGEIYAVSNNFSGSSLPWTESELRAINAPEMNGSSLGSQGRAEPNDLVEFDVSAAVTGNGVYSFGLSTASGNQVRYSTKEGAFPPELVVKTGAGGADNQPPVAVDDEISTDEDAPIDIPVAGNDSDDDGTLDLNSVTITTPPSHGSASVRNNGTVSYTPAADSSGTDTFTYTIRDDQGAPSNEATVTITVRPVNDAPVAGADAATIMGATPAVIDVLANDGDIDGTLDATTVHVVDLPIGGTVVVNPFSGLITYTPDAGFSGSDTFTYTVDDNDGATSNIAMVTISSDGGGGGTSLLTFLPTDDGQVKLTAPGRNYGRKTTTKVERNKFVSYFKFEVAGLTGPVRSARLRLYVSGGSADGGSIWRVSNDYANTPTPWVESGLTSGNAPEISGSPLGSLGTIIADQVIELDVKTAVAGNGTVSFAIKSNSIDQAKFHTKEGEFPPELAVETGSGGGATQHSLSISTQGAGSVALAPQGTVFDDGTVVQLTATADDGWQFSSWSGDLSGSANPAAITMDADKQVTAIFATAGPQQVTLTVTTEGSGSVALDPPGGVYDEGVQVQVAALPDAGWQFSTWGGDVDGTEPVKTLIMSSDKSIVATFTQESGSGGQTFTFNPADDAQVKSTRPTVNFGDDPIMRVRKGRPSFNSYLKFDITGLQGEVIAARIRLYVTDDSPDGGAVYSVANHYKGSNSPWSEDDLNWDNAPVIEGSELSRAGAVSVGTWVELDVTPAIARDGVFSFALTNKASNSVMYSTQEGDHAPELVVETALSNAASKKALRQQLMSTDSGPVLPDKISLSQNYPNPFNAGTTIEYALPAETRVRIAIYNLKGQEIRILVDEVQQAGIRKASWYGKNNAGHEVASGVYFVQLTAGKAKFVRKVALQK